MYIHYVCVCVHPVLLHFSNKAELWGFCVARPCEGELSMLTACSQGWPKLSK